MSSACSPSSAARAGRRESSTTPPARRRHRRHAGRARRGRPLPARLDGVARARLPRRGGEPERPRGVGREPEALVVALASRRDRGSRTSSSSTKGLGEPGVPVVGGDTRAAPRAVISATAIGGATRPGRAGARPGDLLVVTGPLGGAGPPSAQALRAAADAAREGERASPATARAMMDISDGSRWTPATWRGGRACAA